jgi:RNA 3'-terminal phosphate cyclase (ATP)
LSAVSGKAIRIERIRAGREKPGLMRQHLTAMKAAAEICDAEMIGAELQSQTLQFQPGPVRPGSYEFRVGTAGSATLVLQTVLPALIQAEASSEIVIEGGTHNQWAPPFDYLQRVFLPLLNRMGPAVEASLERYGFFPAGGGRIHVTIQPAKMLTGFNLLERGAAVSKFAGILISNLPLNIAEREAERLARRLNLQPNEILINPVTAHGPGNLVFAELAYENVTELATGFGRVGTSAEHVAEETVQQIREYLKSPAPVGEYLADQILLPLAMSAAQPYTVRTKRGGSFRTHKLSRHTTTHIDLLRTLLPVKIEVMELESDHLVTVSPVDTNQVNNADVLADDPLSENEFFSWKEEPPSSSL